MALNIKRGLTIFGGITFMRLKKIVAIIAAVVFASGCSGEEGDVIYNENNVAVYKQSDNNQKIYNNNNESFEMVCPGDWDVRIDDGGYLAKFMLKTDNGEVWLGVKKESLEPDERDINVLKNKYTNELKNGIVKSANVTISGKKGKWIKVEPIDGSGIGLKNKRTGKEVEIDRKDLVTNDENSSREDLIFILDEDCSYVFLYHADSLSLYNGYTDIIDELLGTFKFTD